MAEVERGQIRVGEETISYRVRRSARRRKTIQLSINNGQVLVAAPAGTGAGELEAIVRRRAAWIISHLQQAAAQPPPRHLSDRQALPYLGRSIPLSVQAAGLPDPPPGPNELEIRVVIPDHLEDAERDRQTRRAVAEWYLQQAGREIGARVKRWGPKLGQGENRRVVIGAQRSIWGSCSADGTLRFSWRVMMLEPNLVDYVVVHELAHLTVRDHSKRFWDLVTTVMPDARIRRRQLRNTGRTLPL